MNVIELHIENQRVDLFDNETVELSSSIQNVKDIGRVFTDFTRDFTVPASPANNKIFKHYYDNTINNGFDGRTKKESVIFVNQIQFRRGRIQLLGVDMRNNVPFAYRLVFYGGIVNITDLFGEDTLSALRGLRNYDHDFNPLESGGSNMKNGFTTGLTLNSKTNAVIYPLITAQKRLYYKSGTPESTDPDGNIYYDSTTPSTTRGLHFRDLKPAIKCIHIIEAIEERYNMEFTRDFFDDTAFDNLYMWCHKNKGNFFENENENVIPNGKTLEFNTTPTLSSDIAITSISSDNIVLEIDTTSSTAGYEHFISLAVNTSTTGSGTRTGVVGIVDDQTGRVVAKQSVEIGNNVTVNFRLPRNVGKRYYTFQILEVEADSITFPNITYSATLEVGSLPAGEAIALNPDAVGRFDRYATTQTQTFTGRIQIRNILPEIKVYDFLDGLFKMFNLTAYYVDDVLDADFGKVKVQTLDSYYADAVNSPLGEIADVTKYIDIDSHTVDVGLPYSDIEFKYDDPKTLFAEKHLESFDIEWGSSKYRPLGLDIGSQSYNIKVPFTHLKFERLYDSAGDGGSKTDILWGYTAGGDFKSDTDKTPPTLNYEPQETSPILFYGIRETSISTSINFIGYGSNDTGEVTNYWRASNTNEDGSASTAPAFTLNFDNEIDEWNLTDYEGSTNSLFKKFYKTYIEEVFSETRRLFRVTAYLPNSFLLNYRLNNKIRIGNKLFRINSVKTNLLNGKSEMELLSIQE